MRGEFWRWKTFLWRNRWFFNWSLDPINGRKVMREVVKRGNGAAAALKDHIYVRDPVILYEAMQGGTITCEAEISINLRTEDSNGKVMKTDTYHESHIPSSSASFHSFCVDVCQGRHFVL